jgi:hypothetical protein
MTAVGLRGRVSLVIAVLLLVAVPLVPGVLADGSPAALIRLPAESIVVLLLLAVLPWRPARVVVAVAFGLLIVVALILAGIDAGFESVLHIHFDPLAWQQLGDAFGVVQDSLGPPAAIAVVAVLAIVAAGLVVTLAWAALRVDTAVRPDLRRGTMVASAVTATWVVAALLGSQLVPGHPVAAAASLDAITSTGARATAGLATQASLRRAIATDPYSGKPASDLLTSLKGKDVIFAFVESYGQVAVQGSSFSGGIDKVLHDGQGQLTADGYSSQSAFLTSSTFGGISWLAHSTLQTGLWVNKQSTYNEVVQSDRFTLSDAFGKAGWRTVSDVPSDTQPWSFGKSFYHFDTLYNANNVGYQGPRFGYGRIPDQYTWKYFNDHELAGPHQPVMGEIDLVTSHTPWTPSPQLVPWSQIGDGSVYDPQPAQGQPASAVWPDPKKVQQAYAQSVQYSLGAMFSFLHNSDDPNLVLVVLGDHQPATIVSGQGANHQVPISIISKDSTVFQSIAGWHWQNGVLPAPDAPLWPMSAFRDRFFAAFGAKG